MLQWLHASHAYYTQPQNHESPVCLYELLVPPLTEQLKEV
jgi:hypothetical protein